MMNTRTVPFRRLWLIAAVFLVLPLASVSQGWRNGEMEVVVGIRHKADLEILHMQGWSYDRPAGIPGHARVYLVDKELAELEKSGMDYYISIPDLKAHYKGFWEALVPPGYYTYEEVVAIADSLAAAFPDICQKTVIGTSVQGRQMPLLKISNNVTVNEAEPAIFFEGGIHGDEVGTVDNLVRFARDLCKGYGNNTLITNLINSREIYLLLMVNPDGRVLMTRYNANSVDLNRDGGYMWNGEGNSNAAWSQVETKALRNFLSENPFVVSTDYHSGTEFISYPWSYRPDAAPDHSNIHSLALVYANNSGYSGIPVSAGYSGMYPINGSTKDFNYGMWGSIAWSIEISNSKQPPASQIYSFYLKNKPAMLALIEKAGNGIWGMITDSVTGDPVAARIRVNGTVPLYNDPAVGNYHKYVSAGNYSLSVSANGYKTKTVTGISVSSFSATRVDVQLSPLQKYYAHKIEGSYIPGNNFEDEGHTWAATGAPDGVNYSIGKNGWVVLDMKDTIYNGNGNDFRVVEGDGTPEPYTVHASLFRDGPWKLVGSATGTHEFDLASAILPKARFLRINDNGTGPAVTNDAGFDLDAVEILYIPASANFAASGTLPCVQQAISFMDISYGKPVAWQWQFPGATPASSTQQHPSGIIYATPGAYDVTLTVFDGTSSTSLTKAAYIQAFTSPDPPPAPMGDSVQCTGNLQSIYIALPAPNATACGWSLEPPEAGNLNPDFTTAIVEWATGFDGIAEIRVMQHTPCGSSEWSTARTVQFYPAPEVNLGNDTTVAAYAQITLDAGNPGCTYLWNTGETTPAILADSTGFGTGIREYSVWVTSPGNCAVADTIQIHFSIEAGIKPKPDSFGRLYPNPATQGIWYEPSPANQATAMEVINSEGRRLREIPVRRPINPHYISLHGMPPGVYYLRVQSVKGTSVLPFMIR